MPTRKISALNVYRTYFPDPQGGMQEAIRQVCLAGQQFGVDSTVFTLSPTPNPSEIERPEARIVRARSWAAPASCDLGGYSSFRRFSSLARQSDVLNFWYPWPFADLLYMVSGTNKPAVLNYVSDVVRQKFLGAAYAPLMWRTLHRVQAIVANCPAYAETSPVLSHPDICDKVSIIPLGIDENSYPTEGDDSIFERISVAADVPYFLFIGVLRYYKGVHFLIEAAHQTGMRVIIAGDGPEGARLKAQANSLGAKEVIFAGHVSDAEKVALIKACKGLILPSYLRSEAYGMVLVEAAMFGKPMISCEIGTGTSFVNAHKETGLVVPPANSVALAEAMTILLNDDNLLARLGINARKRYENLFSGAALGKAYADLFQKLS